MVELKDIIAKAQELNAMVIEYNDTCKKVDESRPNAVLSVYVSDYAIKTCEQAIEFHLSNEGSFEFPYKGFERKKHCDIYDQLVFVPTEGVKVFELVPREQ